jgi:hypothetical protein
MITDFRARRNYSAIRMGIPLKFERKEFLGIE